MKILLIAVVMLTGCATFEANEKFEQLRYEANPNFKSEEAGSYSPPDRNMAEYFACLARYGQRFNNADSRFICQ